MKPLHHFGDFQLDVLREVGNIGAGNAATALAKLLNKPVDMRVPNVKILPFAEIANSIGGAEMVVIAIFMRVEGDAPGNMFFILREQSAKRLLRNFVGIGSDGSDGFSEMELSALSEIANILVGSYLSSLGDFTKLYLSPTVPALAIDMAGAILNFGLIQFGEMGDHALLIDTQFFEDKDEVEGHFFFIPDPEAFRRLFTALGVPFE
ncbi:MAG TPA: chemotaxis protein CheC [Bacilli bacterium]